MMLCLIRWAEDGGNPRLTKLPAVHPYAVIRRLRAFAGLLWDCRTFPTLLPIGARVLSELHNETLKSLEWPRK